MRHLLRLVSARRLGEGPSRSFLTVLGIAAGVAALVATGAANEAILKGFRQTLEAVAGGADIAVSSRTPGGVPEDLAEQLREVEGVESAAPAITEVAKLPDGSQLYVFGVDMAEGDDTRGFNAFGEAEDMPDAIAFLNDPDAVLVTRRFAAEKGLKVGDRFPIGTSSGLRSFHLLGFVEEKGAARAFGGKVAVMDLYTAQAAFGRKAAVDRVDVRVKEGVDADEVMERVRAVVGEGPEVGRPERQSNSSEAMLRSFQVGLRMGSAVSLLVGLFLVFNTVSFAVAQRRREIGTLRALGVTRGEIVGMFGIEAAALGLVGSAVGVGLGALLSRVTMEKALVSINKAYMQVSVSDAGVTLRTALLGLTMGVVGAVIAAMLPAREAASVPPVDALRRDRNSREEKPLRWPRRFAGVGIAALAFPLLQLPLIDHAPVFGHLALLVVALGGAAMAPAAIELVHKVFSRPVAALFGAPGRLALAGLVRAKRRSGVAAGAVLIGLSLVLCLATFVHSFRDAVGLWIERSIPADLFISSGASTIGLSNTTMEPDLGEELRKLPGVESMQPVRLVWTEARGYRVALFAFDWEIYARHANPIMTQGDRATALRKLQAGGILVSDNFALRTGLGVGDTLELQTPSGPRGFEIAGVAVDYTSDQGVLNLHRPVYEEVFKDRLVDTFDLYVHEGTDLAAMRDEVERRWGAQYDLRVSTNSELRGAIFEIIDDFFSLVYVLLFIAVAVSVLGVAGTLLAQVLDRTREIGILRAMGASSGQILMAVSVEAALLGAAGAILGIPCGLLMGKVFVDVVGVQVTGWLFPLAVPATLAAVGALVSVVFSGVGGLLPAARAARLDVVEAISYE